MNKQEIINNTAQYMRETLEGEGSEESNPSENSISGDEEIENNFKYKERFFGLHGDSNFEESVKNKLQSKFNTPGKIEENQTKFNEHNIENIDPANYAGYNLDNFEEVDWENIRNSSVPLLTLYSAENYYEIKGVHEKVSKKNLSIIEQTTLRALPLVHGTTLEGVLKILESGQLVSNKELYKRSGDDPMSFLEQGRGQTNSWDRELGLDQYVFADFGRPHMYHKQQEITLVIDPEVMNIPGVFITEKDVADCNGKDSLEKYMSGLSTPEYFYKIAAMRISNTVTRSREVRENGYYKNQYIRNTVDGFAGGVDGDFDNRGEATFSTWEVKLPDVSAGAIRRIIVRDEDKFKQLCELYPTLDIIYEPNIKSSNYADLKIPGEFEKQYVKLVDDDYQKRVNELKELSDDEKETCLIVIPFVDKNDDSLTKKITEKTNPFWFPDTQTYNSLDEMREDVEKTEDDVNMLELSKHGHAAWFRDFDGRTINKKFVVVKFERSKQNKSIGKIIDIGEFNPINFQ